MSIFTGNTVLTRDWEVLKRDGVKIISVKRLSDNQRFDVGDEVGFRVGDGVKSYGKLKNIHIRFNTVRGEIGKLFVTLADGSKSTNTVCLDWHRG